jgi:hypothetical protein
VLHEERIERDPVPAIHDLPQPPLRFLGRARSHDPEPVGDPMDMRVDRDRRDPVSEHQDAVGRLRPDAGQRGQLLQRPGNLTVEPIQDLLSDLADRSRLDPVEPRSVDESFHAGPRSAG